MFFGTAKAVPSFAGALIRKNACKWNFAIQYALNILTQINRRIVIADPNFRTIERHEFYAVFFDRKNERIVRKPALKAHFIAFAFK